MCVSGAGVEGTGGSPGHLRARALAEGDLDGSLGDAAPVSQDRHVGVDLAGICAEERQWAGLRGPMQPPARGGGSGGGGQLWEESVGGAGSAERQEGEP